jgi:hypothetical protein
MIGGLAGEAVAVLCEHHRNPTSGYEVPHPIHARALQGRPTLTAPHLRDATWGCFPTIVCGLALGKILNSNYAFRHSR